MRTTTRTTVTTEPTNRRQLHLGALLGISTAAYAASRAVVAGLQSVADRARFGERQPTVDAVEAMRRQTDALGSLLAGAARTYDAVAAGYDPLVADLTGLEAEIDELVTTVAGIARTSASLPTRVAMAPSVRAAPTVSRPTTHATTGASGAR